jgi:hypothetical protein
LSKNIKTRVHKTIILPVVLYECETWSLILREEHRLRVFGNRVQRRIFGPNKDEVIGCWRKLHNEEGWVGHVGRMGARGMHVEYWLETQKDRTNCEDQDVGWWTISKWISER